MTKANWLSNVGRASDEALFARLIVYGVTLLGRPEREVWLMPLGALLDQREVYRQINGFSKSKEEYHVDDIIPHFI